MFRCLLLSCLCFIIPMAFAFGKQETIRIVGSSTVYPFVTVVAEEYSKDYRMRTPVVEATGTGGGIKLFCSNTSKYAPDLVNASRPIKPSELALCKAHKKTNIGEIIIGYDGIVIAHNIQNNAVSFSTDQLFLALAKEVPDDSGNLIPNPYKHWSDIDPSLPKHPIMVYGPPPTSGTRDAMVELIMEKACTHFPAFHHTYPNPDDHKIACSSLREDGGFIEAGENDNFIIQKLSHNQTAFGITGFSYFEQNTTYIQAASIDHIAPNFDTITQKKYTIIRPLIVYVNWDHLLTKPHLAIFLKEMVSDAALSEEGYLALKGLIPLSAVERAQTQQVIQQKLSLRP